MLSVLAALKFYLSLLALEMRIEVRICSVAVAALFLGRLGFLLRQSLKGVYAITGKCIGSRCSVVFYKGPAYFLIPVLYLFRSPLEQILSCTRDALHREMNTLWSGCQAGRCPE